MTAAAIAAASLAGAVLTLAGAQIVAQCVVAGWL